MSSLTATFRRRLVTGLAAMVMTLAYPLIAGTGIAQAAATTMVDGAARLVAAAPGDEFDPATWQPKDTVNPKAPFTSAKSYTQLTHNSPGCSSYKAASPAKFGTVTLRAADATAAQPNFGSIGGYALLNGLQPGGGYKLHIVDRVYDPVSQTLVGDCFQEPGKSFTVAADGTARVAMRNTYQVGGVVAAVVVTRGDAAAEAGIVSTPWMIFRIKPPAGS